jgi:hypothetical protein
VSNSHRDQDDWSDDSAALFRDARRAHDPGPGDRASFDRVLQRIEAASVVQPSAAARVGQASRVATVAKLSVVVLGVAATATYFAMSGAGRDASVRAPVAVPDTTEQATVLAPPRDAADLQRMSAPPSSIAPLREESSRSAPRRSRVSTARQRAAKSDAAIVVAPNVSIAQDKARSSVREEVPEAPRPIEDAASRKPNRHESAAESEPGARQTAALAESTTNGIAPPASITPEPEPAARQSAEHVEPPKGVAPPAPVTELALLKRMQAALRAADFTSALALCAEHEQRWPHGTFALEREGVHAIAACSLRTDDALPLAKRFLASHPHASMAMRVSSACRKQMQQGH